MQLSNSPGKLVLPFASSGNKNAIPVNSQIGITPGAASLADGFPPLTMTPVAAGGVPPSGLDMNGILYEMSAVIRWANAGGGYAYDGTFAANVDVGGYPKGARVMRSDGLGYWMNTVENNTTDPEGAGAAAAGWVPDYTSGAAAVTMTNANVTLTPLQYGKRIILLTGVLTANLNLVFPSIPGAWVVLNKCTGNFTVTCKTAAGTGFATNIGSYQLVSGVGTNIYGISAAAAGVWFLQSGSGAVARDVQNKLRDDVSIKDFGAVGDGVANDTTAFENFVTYCAQSGATGFIPAGTYLIDPSTRTFSVSKPFVIRGEGRGATILKNRNTAASFIYWTGANGASFENLKIDGAFTGLPSTPVGGGTLVFVNSNDNTVRGVDFVNIYRIAVLIYNDHQTTTTNVYGGHTIDNCRAYGPSNYSGNVGPSAFLIGDVNNSKITNCYISQIGLYGYEFKNDCSNTLISNCVAEDTYYPLYFGGNGTHTELGYVKNSLIENCIVRRATSGSAITMGTAWNNTVRNISIDNTGVATPNFSVYISNGSNNNSVTGIDLKGRNYEAVTVRHNSNGNVIEFTNINDGAYGGRGSTGIANDCANNTVIFGNRDSVQQLYLGSYSFNNNNIFDRKFNLENYDASVKPLKKIRFGDVGTDNLPSTAKGLALVGSDVNYFQTTDGGSTYQYFGSFAKYDIATVRYRLTDGVKFESLYNGTSTFTYITDSIGYYPQADNTQKLGGASSRWRTVYVGTGAINTSDARDKQDVEELTGAELRVAQSLKGLFRKFRFKDAVAEKGDEARIHVGVMAQDVKAAFEAEGLVAENYAMLCYDEWDEQPEELDADGNVIQAYKPAGNRYGIRYDELYAFIFGALANA